MASMRTVVVVEDEADLASVVKFNLEREGYTCRCVYDGGTALAEIRGKTPDLVVLDRMLPRMSGDDVAAGLKRDPRTASIPIIMITAKGEETDELVGFALGVDDYIAKPFSMKKLVARVGAVLRRIDARDASSTRLDSRPFILDLERHELTVDDAPIALTAMEFKLLRVLMSARGRVLTRTQLIDSVLGTDAVVTDRTIDVHVTSLRKKLNRTLTTIAGSKASQFIKTVRGVGYTFRHPSD